MACGSLFTSNDEYYKNVDHLVFDEAEIALPQFLNDLSEGKAKQKYTSTIILILLQLTEYLVNKMSFNFKMLYIYIIIST